MDAVRRRGVAAARRVAALVGGPHHHRRDRHPGRGDVGGATAERRHVPLHVGRPRAGGRHRPIRLRALGTAARAPARPLPVDRPPLERPVPALRLAAYSGARPPGQHAGRGLHPDQPPGRADHLPPGRGGLLPGAALRHAGVSRIDAGAGGGGCVCGPGDAGAAGRAPLAGPRPAVGGAVGVVPDGRPGGRQQRARGRGGGAAGGGGAARPGPAERRPPGRAAGRRPARTGHRDQDDTRARGPRCPAAPVVGRHRRRGQRHRRRLPAARAGRRQPGRRIPAVSGSPSSRCSRAAGRPS